MTIMTVRLSFRIPCFPDRRPRQLCARRVRLLFRIGREPAHAQHGSGPCSLRHLGLWAQLGNILQHVFEFAAHTGWLLERCLQK